jgi:hypothetical protein
VCRRVMGCFLVLLVLALAGGAFVWCDLTRPETARRHPSAARAKASSAATKRHAQRTLKRLDHETHATPTTPGGAFELRVTEDEANELVQSLPQVRENLERQHVGIPEVRMEPDRLVLTARVPVLGMPARVSAYGRVWAADGKLAYETTDVRIGSFPAPEIARAAVDKPMRDAMERLNAGITGHVEEVTVRDRELVVKGTR